jgi:hypothetical protein
LGGRASAGSEKVEHSKGRYGFEQKSDEPMLPEQLRADLDRLIMALQQPVDADEASAGWDKPLKARWADWFLKLRDDLENGRNTPPGWGILRAMYFDGVSDSALASRANSIGRLIDLWKPPS